MPLDGLHRSDFVPESTGVDAPEAVRSISSFPLRATLRFRVRARNNSSLSRFRVMKFVSRAVPSVALVAAVLLSTAPTALAIDAPGGSSGGGSGGAAPGAMAPVEIQPSPNVQQAIDAFLASNPGASVNVRGGNISRVFGRAFAHGDSPIGTADSFVAEAAPMFGVDPADLLAIGPFPDGSRVIPLTYDAASDSYKFTLVTYTQHLNGIPVFRSDLRVLVRNEEGFPAVLASSSLFDLGDFPQTFNQGPISPSQIDQNRLIRAVRGQYRERPRISEVEAVIWAGVDHEPQAPRLAYKFVTEGGLLHQPDTYRKFLYVVDAATNRILFQENQICFLSLSGKVQGLATQGVGADICGDEVAEGLPYAAVQVGSETVYADAQGNWVANNVPPSVTSASSTIGGLYFTVVDSVTTTSSITTPVSGGPVDFVHNAANTDALVRAQVNAYIEANIIRDLVMAQNPAYPVIAGQFGPNAFRINTNLAQTCNAFYNGTSINFFQSGGGCANTAFSTVVHHEFGHHVVASGGSGQGAYGEGMSDCMGVLVEDQSVLAVGFGNNCGAGIRNADNNCQFSATGCSSCGSAIHSCGQLMSGCVWDLRELWLAQYPADYRQRLANIVINSVPLHGPVTTINADITIDFLTLNDDNADITDGTPDYLTIADAFGQHGMPAPPIQALKFTFPNGVPTAVAPNGTTTLAVQVENLSGVAQPGTGVFFWRSGSAGPFTSVPMTQTGLSTYSVQIPSTVCLSTVQFYVQAQTTTNLVVSSPGDAPTTVYSAISAGGVDLAVDDELESGGTGWQAGIAGDNATSGQWVLVDPIGTAAQPENDRTPDGVNCFITGQGSPGGSLGEADIDNGVTTLVSPVFSALGGDAAFVSYWRWYSNNTGASPNADSMPVEISNNGGATWTLLENVSENANAWVFRSFRVSDFVAPTANMRLRWRASDLGSGSLVEAGVDDFRVTIYDCTVAVPGDLNGDGSVDAADLAILLGAWGGSGAADLNGDGTVDASDLAVLLGNFGG
jgi:hypothetical protein